MTGKKSLKSACLWSLFALLFYSVGYANAYDSVVLRNLYKSRDALLDQKSHLQEKSDNIKKAINDLNRQLNVVESYLRDTDKNIRDIDDAIRRVQ